MHGGGALGPVVMGAQLVSTLAMFGLIWFVQLVHYPLFVRVPAEVFVGYETEHANRTGWLVFPFMFTELLTALMLLVARWRPVGVPEWQAFVGAGLVGVLWASTVFVQIPLHARLHRGWDRAVVQRLVRTNWLRTVVWTVRAGLVVGWVLRAA